jgi:WD40 repeat protein
MSDDQRADERMRRILGRHDSVPVPSFDALPRRRVGGSAGRSMAVTAATVLVAVATLFAGRELSTLRQQQASPTAGVAAPSATKKVTLPQPIPQPITRTSAAAQVAWVSTYELLSAGTQAQQQHTVLVGVDPSGKVVGRIDTASDPFVRIFRSADGAQLITVGDKVITAYSALDGTVVRTYAREPGGNIVDATFSPDGRWFALIGSSAYVQVLDLRTGSAQSTPLAHDPNPQTPGLTVAPGVTLGLIWSTLVFSPDSKHLYTIVDWAGPLSLTAFDVTPTGLIESARAVDGQGGKKFRGCAGPGIAPKVVGGGQTLVLFCHVDGLVSFIDLPTLTTSANIQADMQNPFWLAPVFTPDGQLLYLHQYPAFGDVMQVIDLRTHALLGPVPTPTKVEQPGPFSWLFPVAYAGGTPSTVPVSPDGMKVYSAAKGAIAVLRVPDLKPLARLAEGYTLNEVWISGDGKTVYATDGGKGLLVIREDGSGQPITITLPAQVGGFFASEHG